MRTSPRILAILAGLCLLVATDASAHLRTCTVALSGANERPTPNASTATGTAQLTLDTNTNKVTYHITFSGLTGGTESGAHIHGFADASGFAGVKHFLEPTGVLGSPKAGTWNYAEADEASILAGLTYVNIHTSPTYTGGEIRGQINWLPAGAADVPAAGVWGLGALAVSLLGATAVLMRRARA
jgi:hypothetical protein